MTENILFAVLTAILMAIGQIFFKQASLFNEHHLNLGIVLRYFNNYWFFIGVSFFGLSTLTWVKALSGVNLSRIYPITSIAYIIVAVLSYFIFREKLTGMVWLGIFFIILGVIILMKSRLV